MAINETMNAGINLNFQAGSPDSVKKLSTALTSMKDELRLVSAGLREGGLRGAEYLKTTQDVTVLQRGATAALKSYTQVASDANASQAKLAAAAKNVQSAFRALDSEVAHLNATQASLKDTSEKASGTFGGSMVSGLAKWAAGLFSVYQAFNYLKDAFQSASAYDEQIDKLAVSGTRLGYSFEEASSKIKALALATSTTAGYDMYGAGGNQSVFDVTQIVAGMTALRDRGVDVFNMTDKQLKPVLDAAVATVQELGAVADATGIAMQQFGLGINDTTKIADVMVGAFQEAGLTAAEFSDGISKAGTVARASGTSLEEYTAVLVKLKQLGMDGGGFQKLFFSALQAPTAKQLKSWDSMGVNPLRTSESYNLPIAANAIGLQGATIAQGAASMSGFNGAAGTMARSRIAFANALEELQTLQAQAAAAEEVRAKLVELATQQELLNGQEATFTGLVSIQKGKIDELKTAQGEWKDKLAATTAALADVKTKFDQLSDPQITGMSAFDAQISKAEIALKRQQLALLTNANGTTFYQAQIKSLTGEMNDQEKALDGMRKRYDEVGQSLEKAKNKAGEYESKLASLRNQELAGEGAFSDTQFALQQQINQLQLKRSKLSPVDLFGANQIDAQVAALQRQLEQSRLTQAITFDPQHRKIDQAAEQSDIATGKKTAPGTSDDILTQIDSLTAKILKENEHIKALTKEHDREAKAIANKSEAIDGMKTSIDDARAAMDALSESTKAAEEALNQLKLEKEVQFGEQIFALKERYREMREELGLIGKERPYNQLMSDIDTLGTKYGELQATRDIEQAKVESYQGKIDDASLSLSFYQRRLDDTTKANENLGKSITVLEEQYAAMPKTYQSEMEILGQLAGKVWDVGDAYDLLGKRGGAAMIALVGEDGSNIAKLESLSSALGNNGNASSSASESSASVFDAAKAATAALKNFEIQLGTKVGESMGGLIGALTRLTTVLLDSPFFSEPLPEQGKLTPEAAQWAREHGAPYSQDGKYIGDVNTWPFPSAKPEVSAAMGVVVPGYGYNDTVPAMLTPGERVLTRQENRSYEQGLGGVTVNITGPISVRNDQDIKRLASAISKELNSEVRRVRSGQPA